MGQTYLEPGATVTDNVDQNLTATIDSHLVDTSRAGSYRVTYNAVDAASNMAVEKTRMVVVQNGGSVNPEGMAIIQGATLSPTMIRIGLGSAITVKKGETLILKAETEKNNSYRVNWYDHLGNPTTHIISSTVTQKMNTTGIFETRNLTPGDYVYTCVVSDSSVTPKKNYKNSITVTILENNHLHPFTKNGPLVHTSWGQTSPYNGMTPLANGKHTAVGCVATAMGQIMRTYKWPVSGTGSIYDKGSVPTPHAPVKIDLSSYTYNWQNMPLSPTGKNDDIARLLYHAGLSVNMKYNLYYSSSKHMQAYPVLRNRFGYAVHDNLRMIAYNGQSKAALYSMVKHSIDANIVLWVGSNSHSYILDGYSGHPEDNDLKYHLNLGWGYGGEWCPVTDDGVLSYSGIFYGLISFAQVRPQKAGIDTRPPTIRLLGKPMVTHLTCMPYNDAGAVAHDAEDGDLQVEVIGADDFTDGGNDVYYVASDNAGNVAYAKRRVLVTDHRKTKKIKQRIRVGRSVVYTSFGIFRIPATEIESTVWRMNGQVVSTKSKHKFAATTVGTYILFMKTTLKTGEKLSAEITYIVY